MLFNFFIFILRMLVVLTYSWEVIVHLCRECKLRGMRTGWPHYVYSREWERRVLLLKAVSLFPFFIPSRVTVHSQDGSLSILHPHCKHPHRHDQRHKEGHVYTKLCQTVYLYFINFLASLELSTDQDDIELIDVNLSLPLKCWDYKCDLPCSAMSYLILLNT